MMKRCAKILFGILCLQAAFILLCVVLSSDPNSSDPLVSGVYIASIIFFLVGLCYGIAGIAGINKEPKE